MTTSRTTTMLNKLPTYIMFALTCMAFAACAHDGLELPSADTQRHECTLHLDCTMPDADGQDTRAVRSWPDGAVIYLALINGTDTLGCRATYAAATQTWHISNMPSLPTSTVARDCQVGYSTNATSYGLTSMTLSPTTSLYTDWESTYTLPTSTDIYVKANLAPQESGIRLRFRGSSGTVVKVIGQQTGLRYWSYYFAQRDGNYAPSLYYYNDSQDVSLTCASDGYTPYVYALLPYDNTAIAIETGGKQYVRNFTSTQLADQKSYLLDLPTATANNKWTAVQQAPYEEPCLDWGASVSYVENFMSGYTVYRALTYNTDYQDYEIMYYGKGNAQYVEYDFHPTTQRLIEAFIYLNKSVTVSMVRSYLTSQGYTYMGYHATNDYYYYKKGDTGAIVYESTTHTIVNYLDNDLFTVEVTSQGYLTCPDTNHPHMIDLGLPSGTLWACCNVGAGKPEAYGDYYAWGETTAKIAYTWNTYKYYDNTKTGNARYVSIGPDIAGTGYDAATSSWGAPWRMPTSEQCKELIDNCTSQWTTMGGVRGRKFTGPSGGTIFLPASGYRTESALYDTDAYGGYWSSAMDGSSVQYAWYFYFNSGDPNTSYDSRYKGRSVRPVR